MLIKIHNGKDKPVPRYRNHLYGNLENMTITYYPQLALFLQSIDETNRTYTVTYCPPEGGSNSLEIPLEPQVSDLKMMDVQLHNSPAKAYRMGEEVNAWFSSCFGYEVILAYLGPNTRPVLGNLAPNAVQNMATGSKAWLSSMALGLPNVTGTKNQKDDGITFADVAAYLVITEESLHDVSSRFSDGTEMDVTKFRPNIVLSGAKEAYEEDYWGGITIASGSNSTEIILTQNCARCVSINVDYNTGKAATGEAGSALKKLMKDRRVDKGNKRSPIFGRYGFLKAAGEGDRRGIAIGDEVIVSKVNEERTTLGE